MGGRFSFEDIPFVKVAAFLLGVLVKTVGQAGTGIFTTESTMSAQRAQRRGSEERGAVMSTPPL